MKQKATKVAPNYNKFLQSLDVTSIALVESSFEVDRMKYLGERQQKISIEWSSEPKLRSSEHFDLNIFLSFQVSAAKGEKFLKLLAKYVLHIHTEGATSTLVPSPTVVVAAAAHVNVSSGSNR